MYSVVNGEKTLMETGDVVLTQGGTWHSHIHDGDKTACWIDGLDVPLVNALQLATWEPHPDRYENVQAVVEETPMRFSHAAIQRRLDQALRPYFCLDFVRGKKRCVASTIRQ